MFTAIVSLYVCVFFWLTILYITAPEASEDDQYGFRLKEDE